MATKKRAAGSARKRTSKQGKEATPPKSDDVAVVAESVKDELALSPRKRAKTTAPRKSATSEHVETTQDEPMEDAGHDNANATEKNQWNRESDSIDSKLAIGTRITVTSTDDLNMEAEPQEVQREIAVTTSQQPDSGDTPVPKTPRSTRTSRSNPSAPQEDVEMQDDLVAVEPAATPELRRSGRSRRANPIYDEDKFLDAAQKQAEIPPSASKGKGTPKSAKKPSDGKPWPKSSTWSSHHLLTSRRSRIIKTDCNSIFNPGTWALFTDEEKANLLSLLHPVDTEVTDPDRDPADPPPRIPSPLLWQNLNNDAFRSAFAELQEDLANGSYEPAYVKEAERAMEQRLGSMADVVDKWKDEQFEEYWGQKQAVFFGDAGEAAKVSLWELCQHKLFQNGDVFEYKRGFADGPQVEKICTLEKVAILDNAPGVATKKDACTLTFRVPRKTRKFSTGAPKFQDMEGKDAAGEETRGMEGVEEEEDIIKDFGTLAQLEFFILEEDGTVKASDPIKYAKYPAANAWKMFVVRRNDEHVGSPFMIRQNYYEKSNAR